MKFDVYRRLQIEVRREGGHWVAYRIAPGKRPRIDGLVIPQELRSAEEIARYLDDLYHELAHPGESVSVIPE